MMEFMNLKQGKMTVMEYNVKFMELCWYAYHIVSTEYRKGRKFKTGLRFNIQNKVDVLRLPIHQVLQRAIIIERLLNESAQYWETNKKRSGGTMSRGQSLKRQRSASSNGNSSNRKEVQGVKEVTNQIKHRHAPLVKGSIGANVAWELRLITSVAKKDIRLKIVQ